tara:strand:- start:1732 stop:1881 length:150 start_codon:yes stop_codon:yes gene_type:complete
MPYFGLGLHIGDTEADATVGPLPSGPDGVIQAENLDFLTLENGNFLAFD